MEQNICSTLVKRDTSHAAIGPYVALAAASSVNHCETAVTLLTSVIGVHEPVQAYPACVQYVLVEKLAWMRFLDNSGDESSADT